MTRCSSKHLSPKSQKSSKKAYCLKIQCPKGAGALSPPESQSSEISEMKSNLDPKIWILISLRFSQLAHIHHTYHSHTSHNHTRSASSLGTLPFLGSQKPRIFSACSNVVGKRQKCSKMNFTNYINKNENNNMLITYSIVL